MTSTTFQIGSHTLAATVAGPEDAATFLLIHGIGASRRYFEPLVKTLGQRFRVIALDLPGFGRSSRPRNALDTREFAEIIAGLIQDQGWSEPILVGHSMGCQIISQLLTARPHTTTKAVFLGPTTNPHERTALLQTLRLLQDTLREAPSLTAIILTDYLKCGLPRYLATLRHMLTDSIENRLPHCPATILVIRGHRDPIVPHDWAAEVARLVPDARLHEIPGAPHVVQYQHAATVATLCANLADQL
jgi:pimeloyl-ACP methyl ester carboxylesterase